MKKRIAILLSLAVISFFGGIWLFFFISPSIFKVKLIPIPLGGATIFTFLTSFCTLFLFFSGEFILQKKLNKYFFKKCLINGLITASFSIGYIALEYFKFWDIFTGIGLFLFCGVCSFLATSEQNNSNTKQPIKTDS